jgi:hypothetical protein
MSSGDPLWRPDFLQPKKPFMRVLMTQEQLKCVQTHHFLRPFLFMSFIFRSATYDLAWNLTLQRQRAGYAEQVRVFAFMPHL